MFTWLSVVAIGLVVFLCRIVYRRFGADRIEALTEKRRASSLVASRGEMVEGNRHIPVAMALTRTTLFYENGDMEASLDLEWVREVEYDTRLGTGVTVAAGEVLRLRCYSQSFEFILPAEAALRWRSILPARRVMLPHDDQDTALLVAAAL